MSAKHTPGPWTICEHSWARTGIYAKHIGIAALDIEQDADEDTQAELEAVMAANARLIAAAPDLLATLRRCAARICIDEGINSPLYREAVEAIRAAGGQP